VGLGEEGRAGIEVVAVVADPVDLPAEDGTRLENLDRVPESPQAQGRPEPTWSGTDDDRASTHVLSSTGALAHDPARFTVPDASRLGAAPQDAR
jgi:hypothetical protein